MYKSASLFLGLSLCSALVAGAPAAGSAWSIGGASIVNARQANNNTPSDTQLMNAVMSWMNDTAKVTAFLNKATSLSGDDYTREAQIALNAERDELNHKMVLDAGLSDNSMVQSANEVLANQGTFQNVVDVLQSMTANGPDTAQADVDAINNNRCVNVLPNIDMYFAAAGMPQVSAVRPTGCLEVQATGAPPAGGNAPPAASSAPAASKSASSGVASPTSAGGNASGNAGAASSATGTSAQSAAATSKAQNAKATSLVSTTRASSAGAAAASSTKAATSSA